MDPVRSRARVARTGARACKHSRATRKLLLLRELRPEKHHLARWRARFWIFSFLYACGYENSNLEIVRASAPEGVFSFVTLGRRVSYVWRASVSNAARQCAPCAPGVGRVVWR